MGLVKKIMESTLLHVSLKKCQPTQTYQQVNDQRSRLKRKGKERTFLQKLKA